MNLRSLPHHAARMAVAATALFALSHPAAHAGGLFNGFVVTDTGAADTWYDTSLATANADWSGTVASFTVGSTWRIGGQVMSWPGGGGVNGFDQMFLVFSVDGGSASQTTLAFKQNVAGCCGGQDDQWETLPAYDLGASLGVGLHNVNVRFKGVDTNGGSGTQWLDNSGAGWTAQVQVNAAPVPEPSSLALMLAGLGLAGAAARRRHTARS